MKLAHTLGFRFASVTALVIVLIAALLTANAVRLVERDLLKRENERIRDVGRLINAAVASRVAENQLDRAIDELRSIRRDADIEYFALLDSKQGVLALDGWPPGAALPTPVDRLEAVPAEHASIDAMATLFRDGKIQGYVRFGLAADGLRAARQQMLVQSLLMTLIATVIGVLAAWLIGRRVTRDLRALRDAAIAVERGEPQARLPVHRVDEVGELTLAFNRMTQTLRDRMQALAQSEARFHAIADHTYGVEAWFDPRGKLIWISRSVERVTGYSAAECALAADPIELLVYAKDRKAAREAHASAMRGEVAENRELRIQRKDGSVTWVALNWQPIFSPEGKNLGLRVSGDDVSARKLAEIKLLDTVVDLRREQALREYYLKRSEDERLRLAALLDVLKLGILFVGRDHRIVYTNRAFGRVWGFREDEDFSGMREAVLLERKAELLVDADDYVERMDQATKSTKVSDPFDVALRDGRMLAGISAVVSGPSPAMPIGRIWVFEDVSEQRRVAEQLISQAERDPLTGLFNRRRFHEELERNIAEASRHHTELGVLVMDLDGFKPINDEFGHQAGDQVLTTIAREVGATVRRNEMFFRLGGDEFAVMMPEASEFEMVGLARRIANRIGELRFTFGPGRVSRLSASIGIALYPGHAEDGEQLLARADGAMYRAKAGGKNRWCVYRDSSRMSGRE